MRSRRNILVNSTILFVVAAIVEMTLHEFSHFVVTGKVFLVERIGALIILLLKAC